MSDYRRWRQPGATYFLTLVTFGRRPLFADSDTLDLLRRAVRMEMRRRPFDLLAAVVLPDHLHWLMVLPDEDDDFPVRVSQIKRSVSLALGPPPSATPGRRRKRIVDVWQQRYWEHCVRNAEELARLADYIHYNPVRHGHARCPHGWPNSSFPRWVERGWLAATWGCRCSGGAEPRFPDGLEELVGEPA